MGDSRTAILTGEIWDNVNKEKGTVDAIEAMATLDTQTSPCPLSVYSFS